MAINNKLGKGIVFPVQLLNGAPVVVTGTDLIESSLKLILGWPYRDRFFLARFGSRIEELLEEPSGALLENMIEYFIFDSIRTWEPRIRLRNTSIVYNGKDKVEVLIEYTVVQSETRESFVYPFYKYRLA